MGNRKQPFGYKMALGEIVIQESEAKLVQEIFLRYIAGELFDYYRKKPRKPCLARLPRFFSKMPEICATPTKPLRRRAFRLDGLITPTLKAAGSNPVGRTKKSAKS